jgi:hypothetical protein
MEKEWKRLEKHEQPTTAERANAWLSRVNVGQASRDIIRMLYGELLGSTSIYSEPYSARSSVARRRPPSASTSCCNAKRSRWQARCCLGLKVSRFH